MLKSESINRGRAFVNIINIRQNFEKHARRLFVSIEPSYTADEMERKSVVTKYGRKASAVSIVRKSRGQMNPDKEATGISRENVSVRDDFVGSIRRNGGAKSTVGLEKSLLKMNKDLAREGSLIDLRSKKKSVYNPVKSGVSTRKSKERLITNIKETAKKPKKAVNFDDTLNLDLINTSVLTNKRIRKPNLKYVHDCSKETVSETPKRIPIYKKDMDDSDTENIKNKKDIYKFTDEFIDKSDANLYDKETAKIMTRIEKAEKKKAKNISKMNEANKRNKKTNFMPKNKKQPRTVDVEIIFKSSNTRNNENIKTYSTKCSKTTKEDATSVQILADVVVHAGLNSDERNLTKETAKKESLSAFDKLKSNESSSTVRINQYNSKVDEIQEMSPFNSPGPSTVYAPENLTIRNTSPLLHNVENTPDNYMSSAKRPIRYTSQIDVNYDRSNNFGFDEEEANSPEKSVLIHLNEVSRKLQKRTPWRNRLIVKNKRILTVKSSSLPNVDQELILDSAIVQKLCNTTAKYPEARQSKNAVQSKLDNYFEGIASDGDANLSTLFDSNSLSPIKPVVQNKKKALQSPLKTNLISTPRPYFRHNILHLKNQQNIVEPEDLNSDNVGSNNTLNKSSNVENYSPSEDVEELVDNSYFGFFSPVKNKSKENVSTPQNEKSRKLPMRIDSVELKRFKKKYVNKKRRPVEEKKRLNSSVNKSVEEKDVSDELPMLGLFDELLEAEPEMDRVTKKRNRKENNETTDKIGQNKKRRHKNEMSEFNKWAEKFNKMCKEVENHELFVE